MAMSMLRNKGGQPQQSGYQPLPGRSSGSPPSNPPPIERKTSGGFVRKVSPSPEQTKRALDRPLNTNARVQQPSVNRTIAPGQVRGSLSAACGQLLCWPYQQRVKIG